MKTVEIKHTYTTTFRDHTKFAAVGPGIDDHKVIFATFSDAFLYVKNELPLDEEEDCMLQVIDMETSEVHSPTK